MSYNEQQDQPSMLDNAGFQMQTKMIDIESQLNFVLKSSGFGIWHYQFSTNEFFGNEFCMKLFGYADGTPGSNASLLKFVHPNDAAEMREKLLQIVHQSNVIPPNLEFRILTQPENAVRWLQIKGDILVYGDPGSAMISGTVCDITEEKRKDEVLFRIEQRFLTAFDNASICILMSDTDGHFMLVNKAFTELSGYSQQELYKKSFLSITHPDDIVPGEDLASSILSGENNSARENKRYIRKDGTVFWGNLSTTRLKDIDAKGDMYFSILNDVSSEIESKKLHEKLLTLVNNSVELMSILELNGTNSYLNKAGMNLLGFQTKKQVEEIPISQLHSPEDHAFVSAVVLPSIMNSGRWSGEMNVRHLITGEVFPVYNNALRIDDPATGKPLAIGAIMRDLRPDKAAKNAIIQSEKRYRDIIDYAPVGIGILMGEDLIVESANKPLLEIWGKGNDIVGKPLLEVLPELIGQPFPLLLQNVLSTGNSHHGSGTFARLVRQGKAEDCYFNFVYSPLISPNETVSGVMVIATEVTDQVKAKMEVEESEKRFRNLILEAPVATGVYVGKDMVIQLANESMIRVWGKDKSVIGMKLEDAIPELEGQPFLSLLENVYTTGEAYTSSEDIVHLMIDGKMQSFYFNFTYKPLKDSNGNVYAILNMAIDVTAQKTTEQELELKVEKRTNQLKELNQSLQQSNQELEQFAYVASHDLQEPLRKIMMFSDLMNKDESLDNVHASRYLTKIIGSAERMANLIKDLLDFSRITGTSDLYTMVDLNEVVSRILIDFELVISQKKANVIVHRLPEIRAIGLQLNQLFYNLVGNALKFTHPGRTPQIVISCKVAEASLVQSYPRLDVNRKYYLVSITDNGIGFESSLADKIFTIFQRLNPTSMYEGTGIGLALCKKIILAHGGEIWAEAMENNGAGFYFLLPEVG